jgi:hypothetical protein
VSRQRGDATADRRSDPALAFEPRSNVDSGTDQNAVQYSGVTLGAVERERLLTFFRILLEWDDKQRHAALRDAA